MKAATWACAAACVLCGCSRPASQPAPKAESPAPPPRITQFYATEPHLGRGQKGLLCYGVENAKTVTLSPPRRELSAALSRCVDVEPKETTTYRLTAEGPGGAATQELTVSLGPAKAHIVEVKVDSLEVKRGDPVGICYKVENAKSVRIDPPLPPAGSPNCALAQPKRTTTYTVTAIGAAGDEDRERVTIKVR